MNISSLLKLKFPRVAAATALTATYLSFSGGAVQAAIIDLGFTLDESGSIGSINYTNIKNSLADALNFVPIVSDPTQDQFRVTVSSFSSAGRLVAESRIFDSVANRTATQQDIINDPFTSGGTNIGAGVQALINEVNDNGGVLGNGFINITTDGFSGGLAAATVRDNALAQGWDSISAEAIGNFNLSYLQDVVAPQPGVVVNNPANLPNPIQQGFILQIADFSEYDAAIQSKVQQIVGPPPTTPTTTPEPTTLVGLLALGSLAMASTRKRSKA